MVLVITAVFEIVQKGAYKAYRSIIRIRERQAFLVIGGGNLWIVHAEIAGYKHEPEISTEETCFIIVRPSKACEISICIVYEILRVYTKLAV